MTSPKTSSDRGFTLIEVIIVVALIAVIAGFGMTFSMSSIARSSAIAERDLYVSLLTQARAKALANVDESAHGVSIDRGNDVYVTFSKQGGCSNATTTSFPVPMLTEASFSYSESVNTICFSQLSARVPISANPAITVSTTTIDWAGQPYDVSVNTVGRIDW